MSLDAIAPPLDPAAIAYFALVLAIYRLIVGRQARAGGGLVASRSSG